MNRKMLRGLLIPAIGLASILALLTGEQRTVSLQIWLATFVVAFAMAAIMQLRESAPVAPSEQRAVVGMPVDPTDYGQSRARRLRALEGLVLRSRDNHRAFEQQLQPQLVRLATHFLRVNHGIETDQDQAQAALLLDDVAWMTEPQTVNPRTASPAEISTFLDRLEIAPTEGDPA